MLSMKIVSRMMRIGALEEGERFPDTFEKQRIGASLQDGDLYLRVNGFNMEGWVITAP